MKKVIPKILFARIEQVLQELGGSAQVLLELLAEDVRSTYEEPSDCVVILPLNKCQQMFEDRLGKSFGTKHHIKQALEELFDAELAVGSQDDDTEFIFAHIVTAVSIHNEYIFLEVPAPLVAHFLEKISVKFASMNKAIH